ncbi:hypothetical protein B0T21DRAFT_296252 [Apiosordaria backusii]|uniref:Uncharacterized protein n=1 Tax=Apiosordaria backusii TaxID=314023 RepID=A0AA40AIE4_9PEZI|nr:hypothetical protein B0T21DRAFT_296252 [Apiosordaria backusii]
MARKKKTGAARKGIDGQLGLPKHEVDPRPETSPYASPTCTVPFASPLALPKDILLRSPRLHAAYEDNLPELPEISDDVGHVLVHYLHTGTYETLKPKPLEDLPRQIAELKTSIQAYAAAKHYDLPDLMKLAEAKIEKFGEGLPLPSLLEVARDAHPTLCDNDDWFLNFLRARIRPHLKDAKALRESDLLDRISSILSPNRVLLRTVLEIFCESYVPKPMPAPQPQQAQQQLQQPTTPSSSRAASPPPAPGTPMSNIDLRSRTISREDSFPTPSSRRSGKTANPWPSQDELSGTDGQPESSNEASSEPFLPVLPIPAPEQAQVEEPLAQSKPVFELDPISETPTVVECDDPAREAFREVVEEIKVKAHEQVHTDNMTQGKIAEPVFEVPAQLPPVLEEKEEKEEKEEIVGRPNPIPALAKQRERADSGKHIDMDPEPAGEFNALPVLQETPMASVPIVISDKMPALEPKMHSRAALRQADSGFWSEIDTASEHEQAVAVKDAPAHSVVEMEVPMTPPPKEVLPVAEINEVDSSPFEAKDQQQEQLEAVVAIPAEAKAELEAPKEEAKEQAKEASETVSPPAGEETASQAALSDPLSSSKPAAALPSKLELPAEILEAVSGPIVDDDTKEQKEEDKKDQKEKSVSPATHPSQEGPSISKEPEVVEAAPVAKVEVENTITEAPKEDADKVPDVVDTAGPAEPQAVEQKPEPESAPSAVEQPQPVPVVIPKASRSKSLKSLKNGKMGRSSTSSLHLTLARTRSKFSSSNKNLPVSVPVSAAESSSTPKPEAEAPIVQGKPQSPAVVSGSGGGWKKKLFRYPVLFGRGM